MKIKRRNSKPNAVLTAPRFEERDCQALTALFKKHGYPPPHPLACRLYSDAAATASIRRAEDVMVPIIVRKQPVQTVDGIDRCKRLVGTSGTKGLVR